MPPQFSPIRGAQGYAQSNPSALATVSLLGSLKTFEIAGGIHKLRQKSIRLTGYLDRLLRASTFFLAYSGTDVAQAGTSLVDPRFTIITPATPEDRGAQLSLLFFPSQSGVMERVDELLKQRGIVGDERRPDVIRLAPNPLYNTFEDCQAAAEGLNEALRALAF
jgi:kynureninase